MRKNFLFVIATIMIFLTSYSSTPTSPEIPAKTPLPTQQTEPTIQTVVTEVKVGEIKAAKSYGCAQTGVSVGFLEIESFKCDLKNQTSTINLQDGSEISASLYSLPKNLKAGDTATVNLSVTKTTLRTTETATCSLVDEKTRKPIKDLSFQVNENKSVRTECLFADGSIVSLGYTIHPTLNACTPEVIWESNIPTDFELKQPGTYVVELAFPNITNAYAPWVRDNSWITINYPNLPLSFTGAVGRVLSFNHPDCTASELLSWQTKNLNSKTGLLANWVLAGAAQQ